VTEFYAVDVVNRPQQLDHNLSSITLLEVRNLMHSVKERIAFAKIQYQLDLVVLNVDIIEPNNIWVVLI
jgi:hypothetical protein